MKYWKALFVSSVILAGLGCKNKKNISLEECIDKFYEAIVNADQQTLKLLTDEALSYGHSGGLIEDKTTFIQSIVSGKYNMLTAITKQQILLQQDNFIIVRHLLTGKVHDAGKEPGELVLHVMMVWVEDTDGWKLLARQAVKWMH